MNITKIIDTITNLPIELAIPFGLWAVIIIFMLAKLVASIIEYNDKSR